jgi:DNA polymerase V
MYALVDCNTFYASCEAIFNPAVRGKPIVVLSNNDGCIISRNKEAKALGIPGMLPFFQVRKQVEDTGCHIFSSNYELYGDISARVMKLMEPCATEMEVYSIDEAFLRLPGERFGTYHEQGMHIKDMLWQHIRMPVCVGVAPTKTLAKLANQAAKKIPRLNGVCVLDTKEKWEWLLARVPLDGIWGIGRRIQQRLHDMGIHNALQLAQSDPKWLRRRFSVVLEKTIRELGGEPCLDLDLNPEPKKEIICSRSFSYKVTELHELQQAVSLYAGRACEKMRRQNGLTASLWVYLESFQNQVHLWRHRFVQLPTLTNDTRLIARAGADALEQIYRPGIRYKKCGIGLLDLRTRKYEQLDFYAPRQSEKSRHLMHTVDRINERFGRYTVQLANTGIQPKWLMSRNFKSPAYTTRWADIPVVRC